jgi:hypothetical protein
VLGVLRAGPTPGLLGSRLPQRQLQLRRTRADTSPVNIYDVNHVNGDIYEIEAEFFEREDDDWIFYAHGVEVYRVSWFDVLGVAKSTLREPPATVQTTDSATIWI